jgi:hypothetical protein
VKLKEIFLDWFIYTSLFEMAHERKNAIKMINDRSHTIGEHIIKMLAFNDPYNFTHWATEINGRLNELSGIQIKPKNKMLPFEIFHEYLWEGWFGHGSVSVERMIEKMMNGQYKTEVRTLLTADQIWEVMRKVYVDFSRDLSNVQTYGRVLPIQEYLQRYM